MHIINKNKILDIYYNEASLKEKETTQNHIKECNLCAEYLESLNMIEKKLDFLHEQKPSDKVLSNILESVETVPTRELKSETTIEIAPFFHIVLGLVFLSAFVYFIVLQLSTITLWKSIEEHWFIQIFGSVGIPVIIVLTIGTFISLALTPILIFELNNNKSNNLT